MAKVKKSTIKEALANVKKTPVGSVAIKPQVYLINVVGDVDPELEGPFTNFEALADRAKELRAEDAGMENGLFYLDIDAKGKPSIHAFSGAFFDDEEIEEPEEDSDTFDEDTD
jgi:hypothetical protein